MSVSPHTLFKSCFGSEVDTSLKTFGYVNNNVPVQIQLLGWEKPLETDGTSTRFAYLLNKVYQGGHHKYYTVIYYKNSLL